MKLGTQFHMPAKVTAHLNGGYTRIKILPLGVDCGDADSPQWEIPTDCIPLELRKLGSLIMVHHTAIHPEANDAIDAIRFHLHDFVVEPLSEADKKKLKETVPAFYMRPAKWPKKNDEPTR